MPAATFVGPLLGSAIAHGTGVIVVQPPYLLMALAQLVIGTSVGVRFCGFGAARLAGAMLLGAGGTLLMLLITLAFGGALHQLTGQPLALLLLAFIPGGLVEMSLIALGLGADPAFVVTHHATRIFLVVLIALPVSTWLRRSGRLGAPDRAAALSAAGASRSIAALLALALLGGAGARADHAQAADPAWAQTLRVAQYNVQFVTPWRFGRVSAKHWPNTEARARAIGETLACFDIVALNETINDARRGESCGDGARRRRLRSPLAARERPHFEVLAGPGRMRRAWRGSATG